MKGIETGHQVTWELLQKQETLEQRLETHGEWGKSSMDIRHYETVCMLGFHADLGERVSLGHVKATGDTGIE